MSKLLNILPTTNLSITKLDYLRVEITSCEQNIKYYSDLKEELERIYKRLQHYS